MLRSIAVAALLMVMLSPATAASFDCAKAQTPFEQAICADAETSRQDEVLAQAYATALGGLSKPATDEVKATQKIWLGYAERICSDDAEPIATPYTSEQKLCLGATFRSRVGDLEASRMQGGYRFYPIDRYLVEKDTEAEPDSFNKVSDKQYHTVKIDGTDETAKAFNAMIEVRMTDQGAFFVPGTSDVAPGDVTSDYIISTKVTAATARRIGLETNEYWYGHGGAHGNYYITYRHFLPGENRLLEAADIFEGESWQAKLGDLAVSKLKAQLGENYFPDSDADVKKFALDPLRWDFSNEGLIIQFNIYEVTAYALGAPTILLNWSDLEGLLTSGAETIASVY